MGGDWDQRLKQMNQMIPIKTEATPKKTQAAAIFTSELPQHEQTASVLWAPSGRAGQKTGPIAVPPESKAHVSRQSPNARRRKGPFEGPCRIQARCGREVRRPVLHNQPRWEECLGLSLRGVGADRGKAFTALHLQSDQKEVPEPDELLRSTGGDRRARAAADPAIAA